MSANVLKDPYDQTIEYYTGLKRDSPDDRDVQREYGSEEVPSIDEHPIVDLRRYVDNVYTQGKIGSCSANVICAAFKVQLRKQTEMVHSSPYYYIERSRLFVYYNSREYDKTVDKDEGASLRDTLKAINNSGVCLESMWPYDPLKFAVKPSHDCYENASWNKICKYESITKQDIHQFRACLKAGFPIAFGYQIYQSFLRSRNGLMPIPSDEEIQSSPNPPGHGGLAVGYNDHTECITVLNSWGERWGDKGYFYMPYKFITDPVQAFDFWKVEEVCEKVEVIFETHI